MIISCHAVTGNNLLSQLDIDFLLQSYVVNVVSQRESSSCKRLLNNIFCCCFLNNWWGLGYDLFEKRHLKNLTTLIKTIETTKEKVCPSILEQIVSLREFLTNNFPPQWHDNFK